MGGSIAGTGGLVGVIGANATAMIAAGIGGAMGSAVSQLTSKALGVVGGLGLTPEAFMRIKR